MKIGKLLGLKTLSANAAIDVSSKLAIVSLNDKPLPYFCFRHFTTDFSWDKSKCNKRLLTSLKFFASVDGCNEKPLAHFRAWEERFDSLNDCCLAKFPENVSDCCSTNAGCILSGNTKYIPVSFDPTLKLQRLDLL